MKKVLLASVGMLVLATAGLTQNRSDEQIF